MAREDASERTEDEQVVPTAGSRVLLTGEANKLGLRLPHRLDPEGMVKHLQPLYRSTRAWTGSKEEAEDLVQETWAHLLARPRLVLGDDLGYLMRAMHNTLVSQRRAASRRPETVELHEDLPASGPGHDETAEAAENREVFAAISQLPSDFRDALVAVDVAGLSYREAARVLGLPEGTLTSRLSRARDRLARQLAHE